MYDFEGWAGGEELQKSCLYVTFSSNVLFFALFLIFYIRKFSPFATQFLLFFIARF